MEMLDLGPYGMVIYWSSGRGPEPILVRRSEIAYGMDRLITADIGTLTCTLLCGSPLRCTEHLEVLI